MFYKIVNNIVAINDTRLQENRLKSNIHYFHIPFYRQYIMYCNTMYSNC